MTDFYTKNLSLLQERFPSLAEEIKEFSESSIGLGASSDGGYFYAKSTAEGQWLALTNNKNPIECAQRSVFAYTDALEQSEQPAVIVGLYPGFELEIVSKYFEQRQELNNVFRRIYVIIDSLDCLVGWLKGTDRTQILENSAIEFYSANKVDHITGLCEKDYHRSHNFLPMSSLPEIKVNKIISPLAELFLKRQSDAEKFIELNEQYYNQLDDQTLAKIISGKGKRKPRLLMPTHKASSVVQYSTRDICQAFEEMGWEVKILACERSCTKWLMSKTINEFKPDLFIFINHLRSESPDRYPKNMMFISWIQDSLDSINKYEVASYWNELTKDNNKDLLIGYTGQIKKYGYDESKLVKNLMHVNANIFKKYELSEEEKERFECDIMFASNCGDPTEYIVEKRIFTQFENYKFSLESLMDLHNHLWKLYRDDKTCTSYELLEFEMSKVKQFWDTYTTLNEDQKDLVLQTIFWRLNDIIYRYVVIDKIISNGKYRLHLYGKRWCHHPVYKEYSKGNLEHGAELSKGYQAAKWALQLNSREIEHQRLFEIQYSSGNALCRESQCITTNPKIEELLQFKELFNGSKTESKVNLIKKKVNLLNYIFDKIQLDIDSGDIEITVSNLSKRFESLINFRDKNKAAKYFSKLNEIEEIMASEIGQSESQVLDNQLATNKIILDETLRILGFNQDKNKIDKRFRSIFDFGLKDFFELQNKLNKDYTDLCDSNFKTYEKLPILSKRKMILELILTTDIKINDDKRKHSFWENYYDLADMNRVKYEKYFSNNNDLQNHILDIIIKSNSLNKERAFEYLNFFKFSINSLSKAMHYLSAFRIVTGALDHEFIESSLEDLLEKEDCNKALHLYTWKKILKFKDFPDFVLYLDGYEQKYEEARELAPLMLDLLELSNRYQELSWANKMLYLKLLLFLDKEDQAKSMIINRRLDLDKIWLCSMLTNYGKTEVAYDIYSKIKLNDFDDCESLLNLAKSAATLGDHKFGSELFQKAYDIDPLYFKKIESNSKWIFITMLLKQYNHPKYNYALSKAQKSDLYKYRKGLIQNVIQPNESYRIPEFEYE